MDFSFEEYKRELFDFTYIDTVGVEEWDERFSNKPAELSSAIGLINLAFQKLEGEISTGISRMLNVSSEIGHIITTELPYKNKLNLFASLIYHLRKTYQFNTFPGHEDEYLREFIKALSKCEELRNQVIHSTFISTPDHNRYVRQKKTARAKHGLILINETIGISHLLNIYDFTVSMAMEIDEFFIDFKAR